MTVVMTGISPFFEFLLLLYILNIYHQRLIISLTFHRLVEQIDGFSICLSSTNWLLESSTTNHMDFRSNIFWDIKSPNDQVDFQASAITSVIAELLTKCFSIAHVNLVPRVSRNVTTHFNERENLVINVLDPIGSFMPLLGISSEDAAKPISLQRQFVEANKTRTLVE
ncbi:hypothetical protein L6452_18560 [Arctium lappa]|uniref:Uncharacterized protein n=1 Tax=Arctium lappa TaxID=4217 RepID=A0ACB9C6U4_ARCLA|nr:hypothetical protein L6452_18560 [Arctium lappa]